MSNKPTARRKRPRRRSGFDGVPAGPRGHLVWTAAFLLVVVTVVSFLPVLKAGFINYDDNKYLVENPVVQSGLTAESFRWAWTTGHASNWHPLTWLSHMVDVELYGMKPWGHHLTNLLFHTGGAVLLFLALVRMTGAVWPCLLASLLFAVHPLRVESVAWVAERKDVLSGFLGVLALWLYARYAAAPSVRRYLPVAVVFGLGLLAKPMLVTLPFVLLLLDYWPLGRMRWSPSDASAQGEQGDSQRALGKQAPGGGRTTACAAKMSRGGSVGGGMPVSRLILEKVPFFALVLLSCVITYVVQQKGGAMASSQWFGVGTRIGNALLAYVAYLGQWWLPVGLAPFYPHPGVVSWLAVLLAAGLLAVVTGGVMMMARRWPFLPVGWFWYLGMLVPVLGLVQVGLQARADRYTYLPGIGIAIMVAWLLDRFVGAGAGARASVADRLRKKVGVGVPVAAVLVLAGLTWRQAGFWQSSITLFGHAVKVTDHNFQAHHNLGRGLMDAGRYGEAIDHFEKALAIQPSHISSHGNLGVTLMRTGRDAEAVPHFKEVLSYHPDDFRAHNNLANVLDRSGQLSEAIEHYRRAAELNPAHPDIRYNLGLALVRNGRDAEAIGQLELSLQYRPDWPAALVSLAKVLATSPEQSLRDPPRAVALARRADELTNHRDPGVKNTLAAAVAANGDMAQALQLARQAQQLAENAGKAALAESIAQAVRWYQSQLESQQ